MPCLYFQCTYPFALAYTDTLIKRHFMEMDDDGIKLDMESLKEREPGGTLLIVHLAFHC
jgi:hypothetical protein